MTLDDWLTLLDQEKAWPFAYRTFRHLPADGREIWYAFHDWAEETGCDDLRQLLDLVLKGDLRPWCGVRNLRALRLGRTDIPLEQEITFQEQEIGFDTRLRIGRRNPYAPSNRTMLTEVL